MFFVSVVGFLDEGLLETYCPANRKMDPVSVVGFLDEGLLARSLTFSGSGLLFQWLDF
ncbi:TPA: hypothetical protein I8046_003060 [Legionella pneumophila]|nr:hypothetical protein [Legionella pneumophila]